jgi:uncharacterized protein (TIGR03437 family)
MFRNAWILLVAVPAAFGQFGNLAPTDAGDGLYFSSPFRQTGSDQVLHPKIFHWSRTAGFRLVAQRERRSDASPDFYQLIQPDVSGDGSVVSYVAWSPCIGSNICIFADSFRANLGGGEGGAVELGVGRIQLSRNGRYAVVFDATQHREGVVEWMDRETGERVAVDPGRMTAERQAITSSGELLMYSFVGSRGMVLWTPSGVTPLVPEIAADGTAIISDDGSRLVLNVSQDPGYSLWTVRVDGSGAQQLAPAREIQYAPAISNDGGRVVFESDGGVMLADLESGARRGWATRDEAAEVTISGSGGIVFVATVSNRLLRIDVAANEIEELVPRIPAVTNFYEVLSWFDTPIGIPAVFGAPTPGSLNWIRGSGLADELSYAPFPLPESWSGVRVMLGDLPARIVAVAPEQIVYQIPFEAPYGVTSARVTGPPAPFEGQPWQIDLQPRQFQFVRNGIEAWTPELPLGAAVVVKQDFSALVTPENRAQAEEIVHLYATGAGPVEAAVPSGVPTPAEPLPVVTVPADCFYMDAGIRTPLETLYVGLAPGLVGIYQITVRLPLDPQIFPRNPAPRPGLTIGCAEGELASVPFVEP